jgi:hypothetical protein
LNVANARISQPDKFGTCQPGRSRERRTKFRGCHRSANHDRSKRSVAGIPRRKHRPLRSCEDLLFHSVAGGDARTHQYRDGPSGSDSRGGTRFERRSRSAGRFGKSQRIKRQRLGLSDSQAILRFRKQLRNSTMLRNSKRLSLKISRGKTLPDAALRCLLEKFKSRSFGRWRSAAASGSGSSNRTGEPLSNRSRYGRLKLLQHNFRLVCEHRSSSS